MYDCMWMILDLRNGKTMAVPLNQPENLLAISHISIISNPTLRLKMEAIDSDSDMYIHPYIYIVSLFFYFFPNSDSLGL